MLRLFFAVGGAALASAASIHPPRKGCPKGAIGIGNTLICPGGGYDCGDYTSLTATIYAAGSCQPIATSTELGNAGYCYDTYTNSVTVGCDGTQFDNYVANITSPHFKTVSTCTEVEGDNYISCTVGNATSQIWVCCS